MQKNNSMTDPKTSEQSRIFILAVTIAIVFEGLGFAFGRLAERDAQLAYIVMAGSTVVFLGAVIWAACRMMYPSGGKK